MADDDERMPERTSVRNDTMTTAEKGKKYGCRRRRRPKRLEKRRNTGRKNTSLSLKRSREPGNPPTIKKFEKTKADKRK